MFKKNVKYFRFKMFINITILKILLLTRTWPDVYNKNIVQLMLLKEMIDLF